MQILLHAAFAPEPYINRPPDTFRLLACITDLWGIVRAASIHGAVHARHASIYRQSFRRKYDVVRCLMRPKINVFSKVYEGKFEPGCDLMT